MVRQIPGITRYGGRPYKLCRNTGWTRCAVDVVNMCAVTYAQSLAHDERTDADSGAGRRTGGLTSLLAIRY